MKRGLALVALLLLGAAWYVLKPPEAAGPPGRWRAAEDAGRSPPGDVDPELAAQLEALGYAAASKPAPDRAGVTVHDKTRVEAGLNFAVSGNAPEAVLFDMEGRELHRWYYAFETAFPDAEPRANDPGPGYWRRAHLLPDGGLLAIFEGLGLIRLDRDSNLLWTYGGMAHHDLEVAEDGTITVLTRGFRYDLPEGHPVLDDRVTVLDADGRERASISIYDAYQRSDHASALDGMVLYGELFHTNTLEVLDGRHAGLSSAFAQGNLLLSMRKTNALAVLDPRTRRIVWHRADGWDRQHQPTLLDDGRMLLFDNRPDAGASRVVEFSPTEGEVHWEFGTGPGEAFFSRTCGSVQRLSNGNTLITESDNGRAFEVTRDGAMVWEYVSPHRMGSDPPLIATLFEVVRIAPEAAATFAEAAPSAVRP